MGGILSVTLCLLKNDMLISVQTLPPPPFSLVDCKHKTTFYALRKQKCVPLSYSHYGPTLWLCACFVFGLMLSCGAVWSPDRLDTLHQTGFDWSECDILCLPQIPQFKSQPLSTLPQSLFAIISPLEFSQGIKPHNNTSYKAIPVTLNSRSAQHFPPPGHIMGCLFSSRACWGHTVVCWQHKQM